MRDIGALSEESPRIKLMQGGWLRAVHVAMPTPFDASGRIAEEALRTHVERLVAAGISVFLPAAGNGEFHSLSSEEVVASVTTTRRGCGDAGVVVAPIGFDLARSLALAEDAAAAGADALIYMPPIHPYLSDEGFAELIYELAAKVQLPLLLYRKGDCPTDLLLIRLMRDGAISGIKYAGSDPEAVARIVATIGGDGVLCGTGERFVPYFCLAGAKGFSSGAANVAPRIALRLLSEVHAGNFPGAMKTLELLRPFEDLRARNSDSYNVPVLKEAVRISGIDFGAPRPPQRRLPPADGGEIAAVVQKLLAAEASAAVH